ncbi:MAG: lysylphosphatidylglycerol synthase transmembrane domain-containing protein [Spartobacteria bacterium]
MKKYLLPTLQAAVTLFIFAKLFGDASLRENVARALAAADFAWLAGAACAAAASEILCATRWWVILRAFGLRVRWRDAVAFSAIGLFYSLGLPGSAGGDAVRTLYLIRLFPDKKMASAFSVLADRLCGLAALVVFMAATLAWNHEVFLAGELGRGIVLSAVALLAGAVLMLGLWWMTTIPSLKDFVKRRHPRFSPHLLESGAIFQQMAQRPGTVLVGCALAAAALAAHFFGYYFSAQAFGSGLGMGSVFSIMPVVDTLTMLPVALYGLGLREALFTVLLGTFFGTPPATATLISLGGFGAQAAVALAGAAFLPFTKFLGFGKDNKK